jgi:hypothetical protein
MSRRSTRATAWSGSTASPGLTRISRTRPPTRAWTSTTAPDEPNRMPLPSTRVGTVP